MPKTANSGPNKPKKKTASGLPRGALACQPCRKAKRTCDGTPPEGLPTAFEFQEMEDKDLEIKAENPCSRCSRVKNAECYWKPSNRTGRPKKKQPPAARNDSIDSWASHSDKSTSPGEVKKPGIVPPTSALYPQIQHQHPPSTFPFNGRSQENGSLSPPVSEAEPIASSSRHQLQQRFQERPLAYDSPSQFSAQANLLSQHGSLDGTMDAGALDEALYGMWPEEFSYDQWSHSNPPTNRNPPQPQNGMQMPPPQLSNSDSVSVSNGHTGTFQTIPSHHNNLSQRTSNVYHNVGGGSSKSTSARDQFDQLCTFLAPISSNSSSSNNTPLPANTPLSREVVNLGYETHLSRSLQEGCEFFFDLASQMVPVLGASVNFYSSPSSQDTLLLHSMAALGYHVSGSTSTAAPSILAQARLLADEAIFRNGTRSSYIEHEHGPSIHALEVLTQLQSFLILSHLEFGLSQLDRAGKLLKAASDLCIKEGVHKIDELALASSAPRTLPLQGLCVTQMEDAGHNRKWLAESLRRSWWELFSQDIIMHCSTSGRIGGQIGSRGGIYVSFCSDFGEELDPNPRRDLCSMRVRAVTILAESIKPLGDGSATGGVDDNSAGLARLHTLDVMTSNLAVTAHHAFVREVTASKLPNCREVEVSRVNRLRTESPFVTLLILSCARVHMHRLYALPNLSFQLESGSFATRPSSRPSTLDRARIASSIEKIVNASESLLTLARTDYEINTEMAEMLGSSVIGDDMSSLRNINSPSTQPFNPSSSSTKQAFGHHSPLLAHQPAFAACQLTACWGLVCAVAWSSQTVASGNNPGVEVDRDRDLEDREAAIWKQRKAISNISFAESNMETHARIWPIAGRMLQEVRKCKESVDGVVKRW